MRCFGLALVALFPATALAVQDPIDVRASVRGHFSSAESDDEVSAMVVGRDCESADLVVEIRTPSTTLFRRAVPLRDVYPCERWNAELAGAPARASRIVNEAAALVPADSRRCWDPRGSAIGCVEAPLLRKLQRANGSLVCFPTGAEAGSCIGFDPESRTVVEMLTFAH